jgi:hypothetical protein
LWLRATILLAFALSLPAIAFAQASPPATPDDPSSLLLQLYQFIHTGHGSLAAGAACMLVVWGLRSGLSAKWKFWSTALGGYLLGFFVPGLTYVGTALLASQPVTLQLVFSAVAAAYVAAGGWAHIQDLINALRGGSSSSTTTGASSTPPPATPGGNTAARIVKRSRLVLLPNRAVGFVFAAVTLTTMTWALAVQLASCGGSQKPAQIGQGAVSCAETVVSQDLLGNVATILASPNWETALEQLAMQDGEAIIECAIQDVIAVLEGNGSGSGSGSGGNVALGSGSGSGGSGALNSSTSALGGTPTNAAAAVVISRGQQWIAKHHKSAGAK